jgi:hypothetical protein
MRVCEDGRGDTDKCNAKKDTVGCAGTMGYTDYPGWSFKDASNGVETSVSVSVPPPLKPTTSVVATTATPASVVTASNGAVVTGTSSTGATKGNGAAALTPAKMIGFALTFAALLSLA